MKKTILLLLSYFFVAILASMTTMAVTDLQKPDSYSKLEELEGLILTRFIGEAEEEMLENAAAEGMIESLDDRWSYYMSPEEFILHMEQSNNAYVGIGVTISQEEGVDGFVIQVVNEDGPADRAGLQVKDVIVAVDGISTLQLDTSEGRNLVRGEAGTEVLITVRRDSQELTIPVIRQEVQTPVATYEMLPDHVGLIQIENFDARCAEETIAAIEALLEQGATRLIFDVRGNPGGYAREMVKVLDYLLPEGDLFRTVDYQGTENVDRSDAAHLDIPMAVLVNADSYSAAEFFAAALREYDAAIVVGEQTSGKGYFQYTYELKDGSGVGLSVGKYYTPKGESLEKVGITPDVVVTVTQEQAAEIYYGLLPHEEDPQLQAAIEALIRGFNKTLS
ncbi:MAG: S41 family peptidase [Oscillospiraceae bacterium]|nr:S41 family peptidase [Oscillospiraceae bacterium]